MADRYDAPPPMTIDPDSPYRATLRTNHGPITIEFLAREAPRTVNNFLFLAREGFYDGVAFHRVVPGFVVQGGDPTGSGRGGPGYRFEDELDVERPYRRGTVAMANAGPDTNGSQFFVCLDDLGLPHQYTIFGEVVEGMATVDAIAALPRRGERPVDEAMIDSVEIAAEGGDDSP